MNLEQYIVVFSGILLIVFYTIKYKINKGRLQIDHVVCIFFGFLYYVYFPILMMDSNSYFSFQNIGQREAFQGITNPQLQTCLLIFLGMIIVVIISDLRSSKIISVPTRFGTPDLGVMKIFLLLITIISIPAIYDMTPSFFSGYDTSLWVRGSRGPFLSYIVILITMSSMYLSIRKRLNLLNIFTAFAFVFSLLNLFTGNRGFFITFLISIIVIFSESRGGIKFRNLILLFLLTVFLGAIVATMRSGVGIAGIRFEELISIIISQFFAEGSNVATSMLLYISQFSVNLFEFPSSFLSQFINIIPSFIFPSKFEYLILDSRVTYYLSSSHFYPIMMVNFGVVGSFIFIYFFTYILNVVKVKYRVVGIYPALCAHIPFMFFRDFDLTVVKFMFEFTFIYAIVVLIFGNTLRRLLKQDSSKVSIE